MNAVRGAVRGKALRKPIEAEYGFNWRGVNTLILSLGVAMLVVGYWALSRGSLTLAPILLVLGYCGFVPAALLIRARASDSGE
jgi:hypothetical protein